jgi:hypothetical protein
MVMFTRGIQRVTFLGCSRLVFETSACCVQDLLTSRCIQHAVSPSQTPPPIPSLSFFCQPWMNKYEEQPHGGWLQGNQIYNSRYLLRVTPNPFQGWEIWWQNNNCDLFARETSYTHTYNISPSKSSKSSKWQQKQFYKSIETGWLQPIQGETGDLSPRNMANFSGSSIRPVSPEFLAPNPLITQKTLPPFILIIVGAMPSQDIAQIQLVAHGEPLGPPTPASDPFSAARWTRWTRWTCGSGGIKSFKFNASMVRNYKD